MSTDDQGAQGKGLSKFAQKILSAQKQPPAPTLFLGNLGFETTVDSIRGLLDAHRPKEKKSESASESAEADNNNNNNNNDDATKKDRWIRKIRMGTFEDSGLCKGYCTSFPPAFYLSMPSKKKNILTGKIPRFAFVDFTSMEHATAALIHPKNHQLDGRKLVVEYASADAVRRGGGAGHKPKKAPAEYSSEGHGYRKGHDRTVGDGADEKRSTAAIATNPRPQVKESTTAGRRSGASTNAEVARKTRKSRTAPGAALALAKREQVAIVPSQGRRITFDDD
jgi:RNA recognition motif-containing protein